MPEKKRGRPRKQIPPDELKINYGVSDLKYNERRPSMIEAAKKKQLRYWGLKTVDKIIVGMQTGNTKKKETKSDKMTKREAEMSLLGMQTKAKKLREIISSSKKKDIVANANAELDELKLKFEKVQKIYEKLKKGGKTYFHNDTVEKILYELNITPENYDFTMDDLRKGMKVELEHGKINKRTNVSNDDPMITAKIALAHLFEDPEYYVKLKTMEK